MKKTLYFLEGTEKVRMQENGEALINGGVLPVF